MTTEQVDPPVEVGALPARTDAYGAPGRGAVLLARPIVRGILAYLIGALLAGLLSGLVWHALVDLPVYTVKQDGSAVISERGLTEFFATDAWFCLVGAVLGLGLGWLAWRGFRRIGWPVTLLAMVAAALAAYGCWEVGTAMGPTDFDTRIVTASAGDRVPIDFQLRAWTGFLVWLLFAVLPVMFGSSLGRERGE